MQHDGREEHDGRVEVEDNRDGRHEGHEGGEQDPPPARKAGEACTEGFEQPVRGGHDTDQQEAGDEDEWGPALAQPRPAGRRRSRSWQRRPTSPVSVPCARGIRAGQWSPGDGLAGAGGSSRSRRRHTELVAAEEVFDEQGRRRRQAAAGPVQPGATTGCRGRGPTRHSSRVPSLSWRATAAREIKATPRPTMADSRRAPFEPKVSRSGRCPALPGTPRPPPSYPIPARGRATCGGPAPPPPPGEVVPPATPRGRSP